MVKKCDLYKLTFIGTESIIKHEFDKKNYDSTMNSGRNEADFLQIGMWNL